MVDKSFSEFVNGISKSDTVDATTSRYINCFSYNIDADSKRFKRYIQRTKDALLAYLKKDFCNYFIESENYKNPNEDWPNELIEFIVELLRTYFYPMFAKEEEDAKQYENEKERIGRCLVDCIYSYHVPYLDGDLIDTTVLERMLFDLKFASSDTAFALFTIIEKEFEMVCRNYLAHRSAIDKELTEVNYMNYVPSDAVDLFEVLVDVVNFTRIDIERLCHSHTKECYLATFAEDRYKEYKKEKEELTEELEKLKTECSNKDTIIRESRMKIDNLNAVLNKKESKKSNKDEDYQKKIHELEKQVKKMEQKYGDLEEKYLRLKEHKEDAKEEMVAETIVEVDTNANYLFLCYDDVTFFGAIKKAFPNASFSNDNTTVKNTIDYVVALTNHVDHSAYYGVKQQCDTRNIPFIHCPYTNVELIKDTIADFIANTKE